LRVVADKVLADRHHFSSEAIGRVQTHPPTPPAFARCGAAGESCRAVARRAEAGITSPKAAGFGSAGQFQLRETRPMHRERPHKLLQVGVTPTPASILKGK